MQQQIHLAEQIGKRFRLAAEDRLPLQPLAVGDGLHLFFEVAICFDKKAAGPARGIEHNLAKARVRHFHHEAHDGARRVEFSAVARRIPHFAQHRLVERAERVQLVRRGEADAGDLVDDVAQQITALHAVIDAFEHGSDHIAPVVAIGAGKSAQIGE